MSEPGTGSSASRTGSRRPSSTRSTCAASTTATTTAPATSAGSPTSSTTCRRSASTASGCCPFYPSPLRDGGYDIADFYNIHPDYGTIDDFKYFIDQAHQRGLRVIADLVMNHTSSDHPWFQASRTDPEGPYGDWYVWGDDDTRWSEARIIFLDTEPSNWTWDPVRGQYYWHRFFSHQPDLNYDNPGGAGADAERAPLLARPRARRLPARRGAVPLRARRDERREPARDARRS